MTRILTAEQKQHKADWQRKYMRGYRYKKPKKRKRYGHAGAVVTDRFIDKDTPMPEEDVITREWSWFQITAELARLDRKIAEYRKTRIFTKGY